MKKFLLKLLTVIMAVSVLTTSAVSCGLFETNTDRDMAQIVAKVDIDGNGGITAENIYKRELINGYLSYGYQYVQSYGYTLSQTYELIFDNLINNRIIIQQSKKELVEAKDAKKPSVSELNAVLDDIKAYDSQVLALFATDADVAKLKNNPSYGGKDYLDSLATIVYERYYDKELTINDAPFRFVDSDFIYQTLSDAKDTATSLIESFIEQTETDEHEHVSYTVRTTPTMSEEDDEDVDVEKCKANKINISSNERINALADAFERFIDLGLISSGENYETNDVSILNISYFKTMITSTFESELVSKFEDLLRERNQINDAAELYNMYMSKKKAQEGDYSGNISAYETELGAVSDSTFVVYHPETGYSYVSHLLVKFSDDVKADLDESIKGNITNSEVDAKVDEYAQKVTATDLRSSWVQAGYGVYENGKVRFTDDYVYTDALAYFDGTIENISYHVEENSDGKEILSLTYYGVKGNELDYNAFAKRAAEVITGKTDANALELNTTYKIDNYNDVEVKKAAKERFEDLKFAYSEDEGNFNNYLGYLYSPFTSATQYVKAFAKASAEVTAEGAGAYRMFASYEYGLHIVLCTEIAVDFFEYNTEKEFADDLEIEGTAAYNFKKANNELLESNYISKLATTYINSAKTAVTKYEKTYKDLITEEA